MYYISYQNNPRLSTCHSRCKCRFVGRLARHSCTAKDILKTRQESVHAFAEENNGRVSMQLAINSYSITPFTRCTHQRVSSLSSAYQGRFPSTKNYGKFLLGISVWENAVPFATSSIRGSRGKPGRLKHRERYGTGHKNNEDEKSVNGTQIFHWEVSTRKTGLPF